MTRSERRLSPKGMLSLFFYLYIFPFFLLGGILQAVALLVGAAEARRDALQAGLHDA